MHSDINIVRDDLDFGEMCRKRFFMNLLGATRLLILDADYQ